jgi:predicted nucleotidyltransferase
VVTAREGGRARIHTGAPYRADRMPTEGVGRERTRWRALDPPATVAERRKAREVARAVGREYVHRGATAVVLGGSWTRGDARRESDIDLWVFGLRTGNDVLWRPPFMVTVDRRAEATERRKLGTPPYVGGSVPEWRVAVLLHDPRGVARRLKEEARRFRWDGIAKVCDRWVASQVVAWAEEAIKLVRALATGNDATAAVQRNLLAERLAFVVAIHRRMFWDSENESWERIGRAVGGAWEDAERAALGISEAGLEASCEAALRLFALTAGAVAPTLRAEQHAIVDHTIRVVCGLPSRR